MVVISFFKKNLGIFIGLCALALAFVFALFPSFSELVYRKGLFLVLRFIFDYSFTLLPFPIVYIAILVIVIMFVRQCKRQRKSWIGLTLGLLNSVCWVVVGFLLLWGYNYTCPNYFNKSGNNRLTSDELFQFGKEVAQKASDKRSKISHVNLKIDPSEIRQSMEAYCATHHVSSIGNVQCKEIALDGLMRKLGIAGIYMPFAGESYCDASFPEVIKCFVKAHEMSHGYGVTNEGEADFFAYMALSKHSNNSVLQYCAELELLRTIRSQLQRTNESMLKEIDKLLSTEVRNDIIVIRTDALKYQEFYPGLQSSLNDSYLKTMGVADGVKSYDSWVELAWRYR